MYRMQVITWLVSLSFAFWTGVVTTRWGQVRTTASRLSPDETIRASLVEPERPFIDRNFQVRLESLADHSSRTIFRSPDEGSPYGTERLIWSRDGTLLLLVGRHFFVKKDLFLDNGDQLYLLHHLPTGKTWCNADQSDLPPLEAEQVRGVEFTEAITLKGGPGPGSEP